MNLTEKHIRIQAGLGVRSMNDLATLWAVFNPAAVDETWRLLERPLMLLTEARRTQSLAVADSYYKALRVAEGIRTPLPTTLEPLVDWEVAARTSYHVTGPVWTKSAILAGEQDLKAAALRRVGGALARHVMDGGREQVTRRAKSEHIRYRRVTSGKACEFCSMLASRGAVYSETSGYFRSHDHCTCGAEPVWR
jgi:hypothetical protein